MSAHGCTATPCPICNPPLLVIEPPRYEPATFRMQVSADLAVRAERERLKAKVLTFAENKMHRPWLKELAALFEETP